MRRLAAVSVAVLLMWLWGSPSGAVFLDEERTIQITGKMLVQTSFRMEGSDNGGRTCLLTGGAVCEDFTFPTTQAGHLIQERNLVDLEFYHDVAGWLGPQFTMLDRLSYRIRFKYFYDTLYDVGPERYRHSGRAAFETDRDGLRDAAHLAKQHDPLWNAYLDIAKGRYQLRIGRQDLSWGESDGFRLLDMIEPLDGRFGFPLVEDLDDRRIPLWMVRPTIGLGTIGPFSNISIDGYWVPGPLDDQEAPGTPAGNPFAVPASPGASITKIPAKSMENSRGGGRIIASTFNNALTFSIGHYVTFNDFPSARLVVDGLALPEVAPGVYQFFPNGAFLVEYYQQHITGATGTFALPFDPYTIVRMELAHFWDERVFKPGESVDSAIPGDQVQACLAQLGTPNLFCPDVRGIGSLPNKDIMRWMIGLDRNVWIRWLNPENTFYLSAQYFHTNIFNYDKDIANAVPDRVTTGPLDPVFLPNVLASSFRYVNRHNNEMIFTYLVNTLVHHGSFQPQVFGMYDTRGVHALVPSVSYQYGNNWFFTVKYAMITGNLANLGFFRDRDQLLFRIQYNLS